MSTSTKARTLLILKEQRPTAALAERLTQMYGLTRQEAKIGSLIADGRSVESLAEELCISVATARVHLRNIFEKTGTARQAELASTIARLAQT